MSDLMNITRMDYTKVRGNSTTATKGWWVRVVRKNIRISRFFSDGVHSGKYQALKAARKYRNDCLLVVPLPTRRNEQAGPGNVYRANITYKNAAGETCVYSAWCAWLRVAPATIRSTKWSVDKWGTREARRRAEEWLAARLKERDRSGTHTRTHEPRRRKGRSGR